MNKKITFEDIVETATRLRAAKNADYGNSFLVDYNNKKPISTIIGNTAIYYDIKRKFSRLETLLLKNKQAKVKDESLEDTLMDLSVICLNAILAIKKREE